jgi:hypothetical protein
LSSPKQFNIANRYSLPCMRYNLVTVCMEVI